MDYGRGVEFGYFLPPNADDYPTLVEQAQIADEAGGSLIGIQDHPYQRWFLDTFSLITDLAARTSRVRFFPDGANLPLRHPSIIAKTAASIDRMNNGRLELGLGAGGFWDAIEGMGGPRRAQSEAVESLAEAIEVIRLLWSGERNLRFEGRHYRLKGVHPGPVPAHDIGIWVGAAGPRMLSLAGRLADGWLPSSPWAPPERLLELHGRIDVAAEAAGRKPSEVRRIYNVSGTITDGARGGFLEGPVSHWADQLTRLVVELGMDAFIFWPAAEPTTQLRRFAEEVAPENSWRCGEASHAMRSLGTVPGPTEDFRAGCANSRAIERWRKR
jgi:alkanesulfonate monooxygenase SsuD/methylene tetrahydromethanopterin reductase-like flavin-dependent oxidoreductase (luciferase family)